MNDVFVMQYDYQCDKPNDLKLNKVMQTTNQTYKYIYYEL